MDIDSGSDQDTGSSSQVSGVNPAGITRGAWMGSNVSQYEIDWLYRSRRIPESVICRLPGSEIEPVLNPGEHVVFLAHFERGFGLPASEFFRQFLDFYRLLPHHLPGNAVFYLSCYATFMEAYIGIRPTRETFARFFALRINSVQGKNIPKPKPPVRCGSCIIGSRQGSPFFKFTGLESCRLWQGTFFYVRNSGAADLINLPPFNPAPPRKINWSYNPKTDHIETNRVVRFMKELMKDTDICSDDVIRAFISHRVLPLKRRAHKMSEMYGPGDPTKITGLPLSKKDIVLKARQICQTAMPDDWEWGLRPLSSTNPPTQEAKDRFPRIDSDRRGPCRKRALDKFDPDPFIRWQDLKMGRTPASRLGKSPPEPTDIPSANINPQVHEHVAPLGAEAGHEFVEKLMVQGQKNKAPASDAGRELGHLLPYAEKWNAADMSKATRGLGKDRLPAPDLLTTADARKTLFEELLWEHRDLAEAHSKCQAIPEASIEALKTQLAAAEEKKDQLIRQHKEDLSAQETRYGELKRQYIQLGLDHAKTLQAAESAAEAKLHEALEDAGNANVVLQAELEEAAKVRKASEDKAARLEAEQKEYDLLVTQTDALALRLFPDSQAFAEKRVGERRVAQAYKNLSAPWDPYDHLVALNAQVSHMRTIDRNLSDIPDLATQLFRTLWPGEEVPDTFSLISDRLKGAGRRIREWQCSAARAGADSALRVACSWYPELDLDVFTGVREGAETDLDPVLAAKRQDRAYHIVEYAEMRTFIPPPADVKDYLSDEEEDEDADEAGAGDAPPGCSDANDAPSDAPVA
ncbi:hypothetical protein QYE76_061649 [Lolium multiflorum]|uniref:Transposase (putative) gypsy type domain-containing protein n=1 Tax=Lolium multiflorum TaxID=4521 RepID=A0AAD8S1G5_LOLMU|nr:hypothetical protein QYE76_061649 [Lolium multiflorum]